MLILFLSLYLSQHVSTASGRAIILSHDFYKRISAKNKKQSQARMKQVTPWVRVLGAASAVLILVIAGMAVWQRINQGY